MNREVVFEYSIFPRDPTNPQHQRMVWRLQGTIIGKRFWNTERGITGYYEICRGPYTGDKSKDNITLLPLSVIETMWSA